MTQRTAKSFERRRAKLKPQPRVLVLCEDSKSCLEYLLQAAQHFRSTAQIEISHCGHTDPKGIVKEAIRRKSKFEKVYCAIDRDSHQGFDEALTHARTGGVVVIASYPSYEFWLLLHFRKTRAEFISNGHQSAAERVIRELRDFPDMAAYEKGATKGLFATLLPRLTQAEKNAAEILLEAEADGAINPSTQLHLLLVQIKRVGAPLPLD